MKFACVTKFYDHGKVNANVIMVGDDAQNSYESKNSYDLYIDVFDTEKEAESWKKEAYKA